MEWTRERLSRTREPHLRATVPLDRIEIVPLARGEAERLATAIAAFRRRLEARRDSDTRMTAYTRRIR